jgi:maltodextrin utilization protein YvdJ
MSVLNKILSSGATALVNSVGSIVDNLHTSKDEKLAARLKIKELVASYEIEMEKQVTDRWKADMASDSWLSKNTRPMVLIFLVVSTVLMIFIDAGVIAFVVEAKWTDLLQLVLITVIGAYFGGRSLEKAKKSK